jgi:ribosome-associated protein
LENRIKNIVKILDDNKAENIETIDLSDKNYIADTVVIATALNTRHCLSLLVHMKDEIGKEFVRTEEDGNWSIIDLGDVIIHIMTQSHREKYTIEDFLGSIQPIED